MSEEAYNMNMREIVTQGIIPAIKQVLDSDKTVDCIVTQVGGLVDTYNQFYHTGRRCTDD